MRDLGERWNKESHADPEHIRGLVDMRANFIPVRLYGHKAPEDSSTLEKKYTVIPSQAVVVGDALVDPGAAVFIAADLEKKAESKANATQTATPLPTSTVRPERPWGKYVVSGIQIRGVGRARGVHLSR